LREWIREGLAELGDVVGTADGGTALELAQESVPDLILTDLRMAGMDGIELCRRLRADERTSHIPIIMLSVVSAVDQRIEGLEAGADEYVTKPVEARELRVRVATLLARRRELRERFREQVVVKPSDVSPRSVDQAFFEKVTSTIEARIDDEEFSVPQLAAEMAMSASQLTRKLRALVNRAPGELIRSLRLQRAADLITAHAGNIAEIGYQVGFSDQSHFSRTFKRHFGKAPTDYRRDSAAPTS
jgi:DNA-binding response OmpR family regulator